MMKAANKWFSQMCRFATASVLTWIIPTLTFPQQCQVRITAKFWLLQRLCVICKMWGCEGVKCVMCDVWRDWWVMCKPRSILRAID